jgi:hypothetical protein
VKKRTQAQAKSKATLLFSRIVRASGFCQRCGTTSKLECSHIETRTRSNTRTDERNALCLCSSCHRWWHAHESQARKLLLDLGFSEEDIDANYAKSQQLAKVDWHDELERLEVRWKELSA